MALYSSRCYAKLKRVFKMETKKGRDLKQTAFLCLQGLDERVRYSYLSEVVSGQTTLKSLALKIKEEKRMAPVRREMMQQLKTASWEETQRLFPCHTTEAILKPYRGTDFKKSIPRPFLELVKAAIAWREGDNAQQARQHNEDLKVLQSIHDLTEGNVSLVLTSVQEETDAEKEHDRVLSPQATLAYFCRDVVGAAAVIKKINKSHTYSVILDKQGNSIHHLITTIARKDGIDERPPQMPAMLGRSDDVFRSLIDQSTRPQDTILVDVDGAGAAAVICMGKKRRAVLIADEEEEARVRGMLSLEMDSDDTFDFDA